jgi:hypothetical protein
MPWIPREVIEHHLKIYPAPDQSSRGPGSSLLSGKTSSMKKSRSCSMLASYRRSTTLGGWPILWSSLRRMGSFRCASTTQVLTRLRLTRTKLNPDKCVFGVTAGKLLGFLVSHRRIEVNPKKIRTIKAMWPPTRIKDVQKLTGCLAALSRFISRLVERALPFFKLLQKYGPFVWIEDAEEAFQDLKWYLTSPLVMVAPEPGEPLLLYITATSEAVSMVLLAERPDPHDPHELGSSSADGSESQDPGLAEEPGAVTVVGPSPRRPPQAPMTRQSWGPGLQRTH